MPYRNLISSPRVSTISDSALQTGFELKDIALLLSKADLEVRALLENTALEETISAYACATFAYQNETEYTTALYDAPGRTTAQEYPVPPDDVVQKISRNPFATRTKNKGMKQIYIIQIYTKVISQDILRYQKCLLTNFDNSGSRSSMAKLPKRVLLMLSVIEDQHIAIHLRIDLIAPQIR